MYVPCTSIGNRTSTQLCAAGIAALCKSAPLTLCTVITASLSSPVETTCNGSPFSITALTRPTSPTTCEAPTDVSPSITIIPFIVREDVPAGVDTVSVTS